MRKFFILPLLIFLLGLIFAYRVSTVSNQNSKVREFGPIAREITLRESPKFTEKYQIIKADNLTLFADVFPKYKIGRASCRERV